MAEELNPSDHSNDSDNDQQELREFWGLSRLLMLGMLQRFKYNFNRYHPEDPQQSFESPGELLSKILYQAYTFRNSLITEERESITSRGRMLVIAQKIHNLLYRLHHDLLESDTSGLTDIIPVLDRQLQFWNPDETPPRFLHADSETIDRYIEELNSIDSLF